MKTRPPAPGPTELEIQHAAYRLWEEAGRPAGRDLEFWLTAQERLRHIVPARHRWTWASPAALTARNAQPSGLKCR